MKTFLLYAIFILFSLSSFAQKIRFTDPTNFWHTQQIQSIGQNNHYSYYDYFYGADTTIASTTYKKLLCSDSNRYYLREDTSGGLVYYYNISLGFEDTLYNYSLRTGDKIYYTVGPYYFIDSVFGYDSVLINNVKHIELFFVCINCSQYQFDRYYNLLEGVGNMSWPVATDVFCKQQQWNYDLLCFSEKGVSPVFSTVQLDCYGNSTFTNPSTCSSLSLISYNKTNPRFVISPNPFQNNFSIEWQTTDDTNIGNEHIQIWVCDATGRIVYETKAVKQNGLLQQNIHLDLPAGIYFLQMQDESGNKEFRKMIVEK